MPALLHVLATLVVAPYAALAVFFLEVGRVASTRGLWEILDTALLSFNAILSWGIYAFAAIVVAVAAMGCFDRTRTAASAALAALAGVSLLILLFHRTTPVAAGELVFMLPCLAALAFGIWRFGARAATAGDGA
jgi:hypothetical protein